ncbi:hypothetical protein CMI37_04035 [Candidatus Pacearchaeota archaeon]|nr:hypothetical protein [Candidatus Pacearchaeota archaeon]
MAVVLVEATNGNALCAILPNRRIVSIPEDAAAFKGMLEGTMEVIEESWKSSYGEDISTEELFKEVAGHMQGQMGVASLWQSEDYDEVRDIIKKAGMKYV